MILTKYFYGSTELQSGYTWQVTGVGEQSLKISYSSGETMRWKLFHKGSVSQLVKQIS